MKIPIISTTIVLFIILSTAGCDYPNRAVRNEANNEPLIPIKVIAESPEAISFFQMKEDEIKEQYGIQLIYNYPQRITDRLEDFLFATDEEYDIYVTFPVKIPLYVERDMIVPLNSYLTAESNFDSTIIPIYRKLYMNFNGLDYGMVYDGDARLLFYRKDLFEKYNNEYKAQYGEDLQPPKTWEEYERIAVFLTRDTDGDGETDIYGTASLYADSKRYIWFSERFLSIGGQFFDENMKPLINSEAGLKAIQDELRLIESGATPLQAMFDWVDLNHAFLQGQLAMVLQWSDTARFSYDRDTWASTIMDKVDWALVPGYTEHAPTGGTWIGRVLSISKDSDYPDQAWQVIKHLTSLENGKDAINSYETINDPYRTEHFIANGKGPFPNEDVNQHFLTTLHESLNNTNVDLMIPGGWEYMQILDNYLGLALIGKITPEEALQRTTNEWEQLTEQYGRESQSQHYQTWLQKLEVVQNEMGQ